MYSPQNPTTSEADPDLVNRRGLIRGLLIGSATAIVFGLGGFYLISDPDDTSESMGLVLFLLLPIATGFATALVARSLTLILASLIVGLLMCSGFLIVMGLEGWVCFLMSSPLIAAGLTMGAVLGALVRRTLLERSTRPTMLSLLLLAVLPLFLVGADSIEKPSRQKERVETFTSVLVVAAPPEKVWNSIKTMDRVNAHKGFLMRIGLPVPVSCSVDKEEVGGIRTCYFESGFIQERITEWNPPRLMKLEIISWDVPGRPWLSFKDASYELHEENGNTVMTRTTTIASRLLPAWYWRGFERIGVETEHEYLFQAVKSRALGGK
jgi:hypothetical protein